MTLAEYIASENIKPSHLAARIGVSASTITRLLSGQRSPTIKFAAKIAEATNGKVTPNDFAGVAPGQAVAAFAEDE